ncbi:MAG: class I SAM-dependent methyltransferase [bacterium]|nr:class I SAM-dependent methyltransferase [bacterium]
MSMQHLWDQVEQYSREHFVRPDDALEFVLREQSAHGLPEIQVTPLEGKLLQMQVRLMQARQVLEIGTLGGYSAILLARALPDDGRVTTLEVDAKHAAAARRAFAHAGFSHKIELREGAALETLPLLKQAGRVYDFVFIDADKENNVHYVKWALELTRPGALIVVDNVIRDGDVINPDSTSPMTQGVRRMNEYLKGEPRLDVTTIQTVGAKGYDGMTFILVQA